MSSPKDMLNDLPNLTYLLHWILWTISSNFPFFFSFLHRSSPFISLNPHFSVCFPGYASFTIPINVDAPQGSIQKSLFSLSTQPLDDHKYKCGFDKCPYVNNSQRGPPRRPILFLSLSFKF